MDFSPFKDITPNGYFSLAEVANIVDHPDFAATRAIVKKAFINLRARMDKRIAKDLPINTESDEYELTSMLADVEVTMQLMEALKRNDVVVVTDPKLLQLIHGNLSSNTIIRRPDVEAFNPLRHIQPASGMTEEADDARPIFFDKQVYTLLPDALSIHDFAASSAGYDHHLTKKDLTDVLEALKNHYEESELRNDPHLRGLPKLFEFFEKESIQKQFVTQGRGYNPN